MQIGMMTKGLMAFNAVLTFYILNSQDRRFAQVDADAKASLSEATEELRNSAAEALSVGKMFSGAFGGFGGGGSKRRAAPEPSAASSFGGGFSEPAPVADGAPTWPGSGGSDA